MTNPYFNLVILIIFFTLPYYVSPSGILEVRLLHFSNPEAKNANGECCDDIGFVFSWCEPCDHKFIICVDDIIESSNFRSCGIGRLESGRIKSNLITFNDSLGDGVKNPLHFKFKTWPGNVKLKVIVLDYDDVNVQERVDHFEYLFRPSSGRKKKYSLARKLNLTGSVSSISLQLNIYCDSHYYGHDCNTFCIETNSKKGHYTCEKKTGRKLCNLGWMGKDCLQNQDDCLYNRCHEDATCIDEVAFYKCQCPPGRTGILCNVEINECDSNPCLHGGMCQDQLNSFQCVCPSGYTGIRCETRLLPCESNPCLNGATCFVTLTSFFCRCTEFFEGKKCEVQKRHQNVCDRNSCQNGKCLPEGSPVSYSCSCLAGYTGKYCETEIDECLSNPCQHGSTCQDGMNAFHCICSPAYTGALCERKFYSCESNPCLNGGHCIDGIAYFICRCQEPFHGERCEFDRRLADPCQSSPCQNGGHCKRTENGSGFICICNTQNTGSRCENILFTDIKYQYLHTTKELEDATVYYVPSRTGPSIPSTNFPQVSESKTSSSDHLTDDGDSFTRSLHISISEFEPSLETTMKVSETSSLANRTGHTVTDSGLRPSSWPDSTTSHLILNVSETIKAKVSIPNQEVLFPISQPVLQSSDTTIAEDITDITQDNKLTYKSTEMNEALFLTSQPVQFSSNISLVEDIRDVTQDSTLTDESTSSPEMKEALFSTHQPVVPSLDIRLEKDITDVTQDSTLTNESTFSLETKETLFSTSQPMLSSSDISLVEDITDVIEPSIITNDSTFLPETKEALFSTSQPMLPSLDIRLVEDITDVTQDSTLTNESTFSLETKEALFSTSQPELSFSDISLVEDITDVTKDSTLTNDSTFLPETKEALFSTSQTVHISSDTSLLEDIADITRDSIFTNESTSSPETKETLFSTRQTVLPSSDIPFSTNQSVLLSSDSPFIEDITDMTPSSTLTNEFSSSPETKEALFSTSEEHPLYSDTSEDISDVTFDSTLKNDFTSSPETKEALFSTNQPMLLTSDISLVEDVSDMPLDRTLINESIYSLETKEALFSTSQPMLPFNDISPMEDTTNMTLDRTLTYESTSSPETKEALFSTSQPVLLSSDISHVENVSDMQLDTTLINEPISSIESKEALFSTSQPLLPFNNISNKEDTTKMTLDSTHTYESTSSPETKEALFSTSQHVLFSSDIHTVDDVIDVVQESTLTNASTSSRETKEALFSTSQHMLPSRDTSLVEDVLNATLDSTLASKSTFSPVTKEALFPTSQPLLLPHDTVLVEDVAEMTSDSSLIKEFTISPPMKEEIFSSDWHRLTRDDQNLSQISASTTAPTISMPTEFAGEQDEDFTNRMEVLVSGQSSQTKATMNETSSDVSVIMPNVSLTTDTFYSGESVTLTISTSHRDDVLAENISTLKPLGTGRVEYNTQTTELDDNVTTYYTAKSKHFTNISLSAMGVNMTSPSTPTVSQSSFTSATRAGKVDFDSTDDTRSSTRFTDKTPSDDQRDKQPRTTLPLIITSPQIPAQQTTTKKTSVLTTLKTGKLRTTTTSTIRTTTLHSSKPEICILVRIRPTYKIPKQINLADTLEAQGNTTLREEFSNPNTTKKICWFLKRETDFVFPGVEAVKPVALILQTPIKWVSKVLSSMVPVDSYLHLVKDAVINWVRETLIVFLSRQRTKVPKHISVFNSTCVIIVIKPKRIGGTAARISSEDKNQKMLKMVVCRSSKAPTTPARHPGLILRIKVQNETHTEKKTIYPGKPTVVIRVITTAQKAIQYGKTVATKVYRKTKILLHKTLRRLSGVWKNVQKISEKLAEPAATSRAAIRRVWNDAWENAQKAYERTQQLVRRAYQKAHETFSRYINNIKAKGRDVYKRTYETYLNYYNDYSKRVRETAQLFRKNYERYTDYLRNYWNDVAN